MHPQLPGRLLMSSTTVEPHWPDDFPNVFISAALDHILDESSSFGGVSCPHLPQCKYAPLKKCTNIADLLHLPRTNTTDTCGYIAWVDTPYLDPIIQKSPMPLTHEHVQPRLHRSIQRDCVRGVLGPALRRTGIELPEFRDRNIDEPAFYQRASSAGDKYETRVGRLEEQRHSLSSHNMRSRDVYIPAGVEALADAHLSGSNVRIVEDAGVVDQHVQPTKSGLDVLDRGLDG